MADGENVFDDYYKIGHDSGRGSNVDCTIQYRQTVESFIRLNRVRSVLDVGCGDWQFSNLIPWEYYDVSYTGLDISPFIIDRNTQRFGTDKIKFSVLREASELRRFGEVDLIICKDALQHMPSPMINEFLDIFEGKAKFSLVTNDVYPLEGFNEDIELGGHRAIDIRDQPFSRSSSIIAEYAIVQTPRVFVKHVHLLAGRRD